MEVKEIIKNEEIIKILKNNKQDNILHYYLQENDKDKLISFENSIKNIDFGLLEKLFLQSKEEKIKKSFDIDKIKQIDEKLTLEKQNSLKNDNDYNELKNIGEEYIYKGKVCLLILAGGQGSRLNFEHPKGMYSINMPSNKSLFAYLFTRLLSIQNMVKSKIEKDHKYKDFISKNEWKSCKILVLTSEDNNEETTNFLESNKYFGLNEKDVIIFPQDMISSMDTTGNLVLSANKEIFRNPNGNGGCFTTMKRNKVLEKCLNLGVEILNVISVDNPINKVLDPMYIGYHVMSKSIFSAKYTSKLHAHEPCGVYVYYESLPIKIEYQDFPKELLEIKENNTLKFTDACIMNYLIDIRSLSEILENEENMKILNLEYHYAKRKVSCYNSINNTYETTEIFKFELFFNSIIKFFNRITLFEISRDECFSPVKNADGESSPQTCRNGVSNMFTNYLKNIGYEIVTKKGDDYVKINNEELLLEIDFSLLYDDFYYSCNLINGLFKINGCEPTITKDKKIVLKSEWNENGIYKIFIN